MHELTLNTEPRCRYAWVVSCRKIGAVPPQKAAHPTVMSSDKGPARRTSSSLGVTLRSVANLRTHRMVPR